MVGAQLPVRVADFHSNYTSQESLFQGTFFKNGTSYCRLLLKYKVLSEEIPPHKQAYLISVYFTYREVELLPVLKSKKFIHPYSTTMNHGANTLSV